MANLTLVIDDQLLQRARIRALERGTSVNALVRAYIEEYVGADAAERALRDFLDWAERTPGSSGAAGRVWTREDIYAERSGRDDRRDRLP
ncbi:MAG: hypothetical protein M0T77_00325 [Actinomycetota bacterium]|nr:hypothetical protein [Actinomycetota bacterium]